MSIQTPAFTPEIVAQLERNILDEIEATGGNVTFIQLEKLDHFRGNMDMIAKPSNCVFWQGVSFAVIYIIVEMVRKGIIVLDETSILTYRNAGKILPLPIANMDDVCGIKIGLREGYTTPHWVPAVLNKGPHYTREIVQ